MKHFFDIGANVGQTFDWLATQPDDYRDCLFWLFEPSPRHFAALMQKCEEMALKGYRIRLCPFGLDGITGCRKIYQKDDPQGDSFEEETASDHQPSNIGSPYEIWSTVLPISDIILVATKDRDEVVLDIDCEGLEYNLLWDLVGSQKTLGRVKRIMVEFHYVKNIDCARQKKVLCEMFASLGLPLEVRGFVP